MAYIAINCINMIRLHKDINADTILYHIYSEDTFDKVLSSKTLRFSKITEWQDPWELPIKLIKTINRNEDHYVKFTFSSESNFLMNNCAGMCFTKDFDKEAMWQYYTKGKAGICFQTTVGDLFNAIDLTQIDGAFIAPVIYLDLKPESFKEALINEEKHDYPSSKYLGFIKRECYNYENEVRIILDFDDKLVNSYKEISINIGSLINKIYLSPGLSSYDELKLRKKYASLGVEIDKSILYDIPEINISKCSKDEVEFFKGAGGLGETSYNLYCRTNDGKWNKYDD